MRLARSVRGLSGIVDLRPDADLAEGEGLACALLDGGARILQLRMKQAEAATMLTIGAAVQRLARAREALFVVNDRLDVALALAARTALASGLPNDAKKYVDASLAIDPQNADALKVQGEMKK